MHILCSASSPSIELLTEQNALKNNHKAIIFKKSEKQPMIKKDSLNNSYSNNLFSEHFNSPNKNHERLSNFHTKGKSNKESLFKYDFISPEGSFYMPNVIKFNKTNQFSLLNSDYNNEFKYQNKLEKIKSENELPFLTKESSSKNNIDRAVQFTMDKNVSKHSTLVNVNVSKKSSMTSKANSIISTKGNNPFIQNLKSQQNINKAVVGIKIKKYKNTFNPIFNKEQALSDLFNLDFIHQTQLEIDHLTNTNNR